MDLKLCVKHKCESIFKPCESVGVVMTSKDRQKNKGQQ